MKQILIRVIGLALVGMAIYVARVRLPLAYPLVFKITVERVMGIEPT